MYTVTYSTQGKREQNEDSLYPEPGTGNGNILILADGLGGHQDGKLASQLAVDTLRKILEGEDPHAYVLGGHRMDEVELMQTFLSDAVRQANAAVFEASRRSGSNMGTTVLAVILKGDHGYCAHVGDCALFVSEKGDLPLQKITIEHRRGTALTRTLGAQESVSPDLITFRNGPQSVLVMGCDGLWEYVPVDLIGQVITACPPALAAEELVREALEAGSPDNISVVLGLGEAFVQQHSRQMAERYAVILEQRRAEPGSQVKSKALVEFRKDVLGEEISIISDEELAALKERLKSLETDHEALGRRVTDLTSQLQAEMARNAELLNQIETLQRSAHEEQTGNRQQAAAVLEENALLKQRQEQLIQVLEKYRSQLSISQEESNRLRQALSTALQENTSLRESLAQVRSQYTPLSPPAAPASMTSPGEIGPMRQKLNEFAEKLNLKEQELAEARRRIRELEQSVPPFYGTAPAAGARAAWTDEPKAEVRQMAIAFATTIVRLWEKYPLQCETIANRRYFEDIRDRWLPANRA